MFEQIIDMLGIPNIMCSCLITVTLLLCAITDAKKGVIWPALTLSCGGIAVVGSLLLYQVYPWSGVIGGFVGFIPYVILAWKEKCGGGDALLMFATGLCLGVFAVSLLILITTALFFGYTAILSKKAQSNESKDTRYPYAPFVFAAWVLLSTTGFFILYL